jgi:predicted N-acetyltransferase YhbS
VLEPHARALTPDDFAVAGRILYRSFATAFRHHGYAAPVADAEAGAALAAAAYASDPSGSILLASGTEALAVGFLQRCPEVAFLGPLAVEPRVQRQGHGRRMLHALLDLAEGCGVRLIQDAFNPASYHLYAREGFEVRETLALMATAPGRLSLVPPGPPAAEGLRGVWPIRDLDVRDIPLIAEMDRAATGADRRGLIERLAARLHGVVLRGPERVRGFACGLRGRGFWIVGPAWADDGRTLAAILVGLVQRCVRHGEPVAAFVPASRGDLVTTLLDVGFRVSHLVNFMVRGRFEGFRGACLPILPVDTPGDE